MKATLLLLLVVGFAINLPAQTPTPTPRPGTPFNPFQTNDHSYPATPTPTVSRKALATVPDPSRVRNTVVPPSNSAATNRNSSVAITSPTPPANNQTMMFSNGVRMVRQGDNVVITDGGKRYVMSRNEATAPPPSLMSRSPCGTVKHYLDTHPCNSFWRHLSLWWADNCL